ncbi:hypothetical protein FEP54_06089 [Burkholderia multivorans]|nr:hypothetical protein [Burkholderia multivorans]MDR8927327.1 hypothetical protein [Burkholderia multivorans]MDR8969681.1 hypothetical protein [Burkholderia multivorans]MDR8993898.1 hypothetical protein [Burkholderia multivorans]MDR9024689.1 hypothetical protein [Burkholderia multivorans]
MCTDCCVDIAIPEGLPNSITGSLNAFALPVPPPAVRPPDALPDTLLCVASANARIVSCASFRLSA